MRHVTWSWLLIGACGGPSKPATPPDPPPAAATCDDVRAHSVELGAAAGEELDADQIGRECAGEPWSQETIDCVVAAATVDAARECLYARVQGGEVCQALSALIEASRADDPFADVQGAEIEPNAGIYEMTIGMPGAQCQLRADFEDRLYALCEVSSGEDGARAMETYSGAANLVRACLPRESWTLEDTGDNEILFTSDDGDTVSVQAASDLGSWWVYIVIGEE